MIKTFIMLQTMLFFWTFFSLKNLKNLSSFQHNNNNNNNNKCFLAANQNIKISSQKSCEQMFCMCFMALFQWLQNFSFSLTTHKRFFLKNKIMFINAANILL